MGYSVEEIAPPTFNVTESGITGQRRLKLDDWSDLNDFMEDLYPSGYPTSDSPWRPGMTTFPGRESLVLKGAKLAGFDSNNLGEPDAYGVATCASGAEIVLEYGTVDYNQQEEEKSDAEDPTTWLSHDIDVAQQYITHTQSGLKWQNAAAGKTQVQPDLLPGFPVTIVNHNLTWHRVPNPPLSKWYGYVGKINSSPFLYHEEETVLFAGLSASRKANTDGTNNYECKMSFQARIVHGTLKSGAGTKIGWNHFLDGDGEWDRIVNSSGTPLLTKVSLANIFNYA